MAVYICRKCSTQIEVRGDEVSVICPGCGDKIIFAAPGGTMKAPVTSSMMMNPMPIVPNQYNEIDALIKRMDIAIEMGEWKEAYSYGDMVLYKNPEDSRAYIGQLLASRNVKSLNELVDKGEPFDNEKAYICACKFGDDNLRRMLQDLDRRCKDLNDAKQVDAHYNGLIERKNKAKTEKQFAELQNEFNAIQNYKDSSVFADECAKSIKDIKDKKKLKKKKRKKALIISSILLIVLMGLAIFGYFLITMIIPNSHYNKAIAYRKEGKYAEAIEEFEKAGEYEDAQEQILRTYYSEGQYLVSINDYKGAFKAFKAANNYKGTRLAIKDAHYKYALYLYENKEFADAYYEYLEANVKESDMPTMVRLSATNEGDIIKFGSFEYNVIKISGDDYFLLSTDVLCNRLMDSESNSSWSDCDLRDYLNNDFLGTYFSGLEEYIIDTEHDGVTDKVFLLSLGEVYDAKYHFSLISCKNGEPAIWWTRTDSGSGFFHAIYTDTDYVFAEGNKNSLGVRPALWVSLGE